MSERGFAACAAEAMELFHKFRADGMSFTDACKSLESAVRSFWPRRREWHYLCLQCEDTGWRIVQHEARPYGGVLVDYAERCVCRAGRALMRPESDSEDALTKIGKVGKSFPKERGEWVRKER